MGIFFKITGSSIGRYIVDKGHRVQIGSAKGIYAPLCEVFSRLLMFEFLVTWMKTTGLSKQDLIAEEKIVFETYLKS